MAEKRFYAFASSAVFGAWLMIRKHQRRANFWARIASHADQAYDHFRSDPAWKIFQSASGASDLAPRDWIGPFKLRVPSLGGQTLYVFGKRQEYEASQDRLLERLGGR